MNNNTIYRQPMSVHVRGENRTSAREASYELCYLFAGKPHIGTGAKVSVLTAPIYMGQDERGHIYQFDIVLKANPIIMKSPEDAIYARDIIKQRWHEVEKYIKQDIDLWVNYKAVKDARK